MGIFSRKKKTYVSSVVYNMAGDEMDRPNFLKTLIFGSVLAERPSISDDIVQNYLHGPGMRFRSFAKWAKTSGYNDTIGLVSGSILTGNSLDLDALSEEIPITPGNEISVISANIGAADYTYWVEQYITENFPERLTTDYTPDFNEETGEITITWEDDSTSTFIPTNYDTGAYYIYAGYVEIIPSEEQPLETGETIPLNPGDDFPNTDDWDQISYTDDGAGEIHSVWQRERYMGQAPDRDATYNLKETMYQDTLPGTPDPIRSYRIDTQITYLSLRSPNKIFIYKKGDGNSVLDAMFEQGTGMDNFFPFIPFRLDNKFIGEDYLPQVYEQSKKAYKKSTTGKFDSMVEALEDNEQLDDIDFAYCVFGVSLNVLENASRKYVYKFFQEILNDYSGSGGSYDDWQSEWNAADVSQQAWMAWRTAQNNPSDPLYGTPEPSKTPYPPTPKSSIRIKSSQEDVMHFDMEISWLSLYEETGTGTLKPDAKRDEVWLGMHREEEFQEWFWDEEGGVWQKLPGQIISANELHISWQVTENTWRRLRIVNLEHRNLIYNGKAVEITGKEALEDPEESGFIIPLHEGLYRSMGMIDGTQMTTACSFMVFNCYQVVKQKWYQTTLFKIILVIIIIVVSIYFPPAGSAAGGLTGVGATVATALGLTGIAAVIVSAVVNALVAMIISRVIGKAAVTLFGEKWGAIIGAIVSVMVMQVGSGMAAGQSFSTAFAGLMRPDNILRLIDAAGKGYAGYVQASIAEMAKEADQVLNDYQAQARQIQELWQQNIGTGRGIIDPMAITDSAVVTLEPLEAFLQRTLMTGSDVAELSLDMLTNFVSMTLSNELPT